MGIPKFFRYLSERYPALSEPAHSWSMPEFDNFYLDLNGVIHNCSHNDKEDITYRVTEEQIFRDVFNYIDFLFNLVKPKRVLFLAIDGVAPRAKMNQQRSRRFKTVREALERHDKAKKKNVVFPDGEPFDANCITPGTPFMVRLHEQLKYFVVKKVSTDNLWKNVKVYLSGHLSPGEGEHKIMDFIRFCKSRPDHDPYTSHCLYGLDADLIMLGLVTHEPHFSLLREEVKFVKTSLQPDVRRPETINFQLLHLTLLRDYLEIEFAEIKQKHPTRFNIENIIDDWVLMCMLIGNDFIPHLPSYHINKNSLIDLYEAYIEVMPEHGNINELGNLNLQRLQIFLTKLAEMEKQKFKEHPEEFEIKESDLKRYAGNEEWQEQPDAAAPDAAAEQMNCDNKANENCSYEDGTFENENHTFEQCKRDYYERKLEFKDANPDHVKKLTFSYVEALQWNLAYYYNGCQSWSWCFPYHYAPFVSDIVGSGAFKEVNLSFELGKPFLPYEQLLSVMPIGSKRFMPKPYQEIMCSESSPLAGCYPTRFNLDLNGKRQLWEAVCLIPFINEKKLMQASEIAKEKLTDEEKEHNQHKPHLLFTFSQTQRPVYPSALPDVFPDITTNHAECVELSCTEFHVPVDQLKKGISKKLKLQTHFYGFPSLKFLPFTAMIKNEKIRVFEQVSKLENVILKLNDVPDNTYLSLTKYLGKNIWFNWPYMKECRLVSVFDGEFVHALRQTRTQTKCVKERQSEKFCEKYSKRVQEIKDQAMLTQGILIENETALCFVRPVIGHSIKVHKDGSISKEKQYAVTESCVLGKTFVPRLRIVQPKSSLSIEFKAVDFYKIGLKCFPFEKRYYGDPGEILSFNQQTNLAKIRVWPSYEPDLSKIIECEGEILDANYMSHYELARRLDLSPVHVKKIIGNYFVSKEGTSFKFNIGLQLKFQEKQQCIMNYSVYFGGRWFFSNEICQIINDYMTRFPTVISHIFYSDIKSNFNSPPSLAELFPDGKANEKFDELLKFLNDLPMKNEQKISVDHRQLDRCLVRLIEDTVQSSLMMLDQQKSTDLSLNVSQIYCDLPVISSRAHPDPSAVFKLYDRVTNVKAGFVVPQGLKGIVIGLEDSLDKTGDTMVTVCFDKVFEGARKINTKDARAYVLPQCYLMNISFGKQQFAVPKSQRFGSWLPPVTWKHPQKERLAFPNGQKFYPYCYQSNYRPQNQMYRPGNYHPFQYNQQQQQANACPSYPTINQTNNGAGYRANYQAAGQRQSRNGAHEPPKTLEKHIDVWNLLMQGANEALKAEKPNPFRHLTFNPTINLIKNPQTVSKKKVETVKTIEAADQASGDRPNDKKPNSKPAKHGEANGVSSEVVDVKKSDLVRSTSPLKEEPVTNSEKDAKGAEEEEAVKANATEENAANENAKEEEVNKEDAIEQDSKSKPDEPAAVESVPKADEAEELK